jgi:hypothetical protein
MSAEPRWKLTKPTPRPVPAGGPRADPDRNSARALAAVALTSIAAGVINVAAAATVGRDSSTQTLAFFVAVAFAQLVWGAVALARAPRWWLALGAVGNLVVVATWVASRTVGLPVGEFAGITLPVGFPDGLATALEAVTVAGAALLLRGRGPARSPARSPGVTAATAVVVGALALVGVLSQTGAIGSSPAGSEQNGGSVSNPYAPGDGGGTSGGGGSGGGYSGGSGY